MSSAEGIAAFIFGIAVVSCGLMWPFIMCHYGTHATERIQSIDLAVYNADWLHYPPDAQKWIILIMVQSQTDICFNGFNLVGCNLQKFTKVLCIIEESVIFTDLDDSFSLFSLSVPFAQICNSAFSYYLIFRRFTRR